MASMVNALARHQLLDFAAGAHRGRVPTEFRLSKGSRVCVCVCVSQAAERPEEPGFCCCMAGQPRQPKHLAQREVVAAVVEEARGFVAAGRRPGTEIAT